MKIRLFVSALITGILIAQTVCAADAQRVLIVVDPKAPPRVNFGVSKLVDALNSVGNKAVVVKRSDIPTARPLIVVGNLRKASAVISLAESGQLKADTEKLGKEGFVLASCKDNVIAIAAVGDSGVLYGCLELAEQISKANKIPDNLNVTDAPVFVLRGPCIGMQRSELSYDGVIYDYLYTPKDFPFFYDKDHWTRYLDFLSANRMNTLYLWNGHPFPSLLKLPKYPDAQELSDEQLAKNIEMFSWLTKEADKRGIWVIQFFYNIHISHAMAKARGVPIIHHGPTELVSEYTRYCVSEFVRNYPNVGVMMCLGEALSNEHDADWLSDVIIPGVKDGMQALGLTDELPIIVRAHSSPIEEVMTQAKKIYTNLYTMRKWNGESLTWTNIRGQDRKLHQSLAKLGTGNIINVHLLSNLEPFRWGSPSFVQKCMQNAQQMGSTGLHLYPLRYWDWPNTADKVSPPLKQIDRDWMWYAIWARYAWNPNREPSRESEYWTEQLADKYGTKKAAAEILKAYETSGQCAPMLLRRFGITEGARQSFTLGMQMTQLVNPKRYGPWVGLWQWGAPDGERLQEWAERQWNKKPHNGETPPMVIEAANKYSQQAVAAIEDARKYVTKNKEEFERLADDIHCIRALSRSYTAKAQAAMFVLRYKYSHDVTDLEKALPLLERSLEEYKELVRLGNANYRDAQCLHTSTRRIPFQWSPSPPHYQHWRECLPEYEKELANFRKHLAELKTEKLDKTAKTVETKFDPLPAAAFKLLSKNAEVYDVKDGAKVFTDRDYSITALAPELKGLKGVRFSHQQAKRSNMTIDFEVSGPVKVLVGYFQEKKTTWLQVPDLETYALADDRGGYDPVIRGAVNISKLPAVNIHAFNYKAGKHTLEPFGDGSYCILGFVKQSAKFTKRTASLSDTDNKKREGLDWLFE